MSNANLNEVVAALQAQVQALQEQLQNADASSTAAQTTITSSAMIATPTIQVKQPETYDGRKENIDLWLFQVQQYYNALNIKNDSQAVYYAVNLLRGDAATW